MDVVFLWGFFIGFIIGIVCALVIASWADKRWG
jgi:gas vesicle protein